MAFRLRRICSSDNDHSEKYTKYSVNSGHDLRSVEQCFKTPRQEAQEKSKTKK